MSKNLWRGLTGTGAALLVAGTAYAQQPQGVRVVGTVTSIKGQVLSIKTERLGDVKVVLTDKVVVPPEAAILVYAVGDKSELKPGAKVAILGAAKKPDGSYEAGRVNVGRGDIEPR